MSGSMGDGGVTGEDREHDAATALQPWIRPVLERLAIRDSATANVNFSGNDAVNNYS